MSDLEGAAVYSEDGLRWGAIVDGEGQWHDGPPPTTHHRGDLSRIHHAARHHRGRFSESTAVRGGEGLNDVAAENDQRAMASAGTNTWEEGVEMIRAAVREYRRRGVDCSAEVDWLEHYDAGETVPLSDLKLVPDLIQSEEA